MKKQNKLMLMLCVLGLTFAACTSDKQADVNSLNQEAKEVALATEVDNASAVLEDVVIAAFETDDATTTGKSVAQKSSIPDCTTITIVAQQNSRELTIEFGSNGCEVNGHLLKGKIIMSYLREPDAQQRTINYTLENFYFDDKLIEGSRTIVKKLSNENGNPQFTHTLNLTITWPDGTQATRDGEIIREWVDGHYSGVWSDNVFEITGHWTTSFRNGNTRDNLIMTPLKREMACRFFVSGTIQVTRTNFSGVLNYGTGECDNMATFTFADGSVIDIILR